MKFSRWIALSLALSLLLVGALIAAAFPHTVRYGDTLFSLARTYGTTVDDIVAANDLENPDVIYADQVLEIPGDPGVANVSAAASAPAPAAVASSTFNYHVVGRGDTLFSIASQYGTTVEALAQANRINNVNFIYEGQEILIHGDFGEIHVATVLAGQTARLGHTEGRACTRVNFLKGADGLTGSRGAGTYIVSEYNGRGGVAMWKAEDADVDSGWMKNLKITFPSVHVVVTFYPADGADPIVMDVVNDVEGYGWLSRGVCNAIEIQYP